MVDPIWVVTALLLGTVVGMVIGFGLRDQQIGRGDGA
jgi:hypothetical protein